MRNFYIDTTYAFYSLRKYFRRLPAVVIIPAILYLPVEAQVVRTLDKAISVQIIPGKLLNALQAMEAAGNVKFIYDLEDIKEKDVRQPRRYDNVPIRSILESILGKADFTFKEKNGRIVIQKLESKNFGKLQGRVLDEKSKDILIGASVRIEGTLLGITADVEGRVLIDRIPAGSYTVIVSFIGYQTKSYEDVQIVAGNVATLDFFLGADATQLGEIVVQGDNVRYRPIENSTEESLISGIRKSDLILTGISNEQINRSLDRDAADVVKRIPGVSLVDRFIMIRGLDPRYNMVLINGTPAPSSETDRRAFSFDNVPTGVIDQIMIYKTPAPELQGNFAGGVIDVRTKHTIAARGVQVGFSGQYRQGAGFRDHYTYGAFKSDLLGTNIEQRRWPGKLYDPNYLFPDPTTYPEQNAEIARAMPALSNLSKINHDFDKRANINYYDSWKIGNWRLNNLTALNYTYERNFASSDVKLDREFEYDPETGHYTEMEFSPEEAYKDSIYTRNIRICAMQNLTLQMNENNSIEFNNLFNRLGFDKTVVREGLEGANKGVRLKSLSYEYSLRDLYNGHIRGKHKLGANQFQWSAGYTSTMEEFPDLQRMDYRSVTGGELYYVGLPQRGSLDKIRRLSMKTEEHGYQYSADYERDITTMFAIKAGAYAQDRHRDFTSSGYVYGITANSDFKNSYAVKLPWLKLDSMFTDENFYSNGKGFVVYKYFDEGAYSVDELLVAGYVAIRKKFVQDRLQVYGGVRYERNDRRLYDSYGESLQLPPANGFKMQDRIRQYWLPSLNISWKFNDKNLVRVAFGKTIDRPEYREQSTFDFFSYEMSASRNGNPYLHDAEIYNYDLRYEMYPSEGEFIAIGAFYKDFNNPIELYDMTQGGFVNRLLSYENTKSAQVYGVEAEVRRRFDFIPVAIVKNMSVIFNAALTKSRIKYYEIDRYGEEVEVGFRKSDRPLMNTSPFIVNLGLYYDSKATGTQVSALYNVSGMRLSAAASRNRPDLYERGRHVVDLVFSQRITKFLILKAGVQDVFNQPYRFVRDANTDQKYSPGKYTSLAGDDVYQTDFVESSFRRGSYFSFGVQLEL